jgi:NAD(P)H-flavin reductase
MKGMENKPQEYTGIITKKLQLTKTVFHFFIQHENPTIYTFQPGQYGTFIIDEKTRRQYTFASAADPKIFELVIDVSPMGSGSKYFLEKNVGDRVEYLAPLGNFTLSQNSLKKIFVATGTGIAPFRSMLLNEMEITNHKSQIPKNIQNSNIQNEKQTTTNYESRTMNLSLYWGLRFEDDVYWDNEFKAIAGQYTGFQYFLSLSKPSENWHGLVGHITDHVLEKEKYPQNCEFYLCGNSAMITEMEKRLTDIKVPKEQIRIDLFY